MQQGRRQELTLSAIFERLAYETGAKVLAQVTPECSNPRAAIVLEHTGVQNRWILQRNNSWWPRLTREHKRVGHTGRK